MARCRRFLGLGIQPARLNSHPPEWLYSDLRSFTSSSETAKFSFPLWFHFSIETGVAELPTMALSETRGEPTAQELTTSRTQLSREHYTVHCPGLDSVPSFQRIPSIRRNRVHPSPWVPHVLWDSLSSPSQFKLAKSFALDIPVGCVVLFQRTKSLIGGGASKGMTHSAGC